MWPDDFYMEGFWDLNSTRRYEHGPIPWDLIVQYGREVGLHGDVIREVFVPVIRAIDVSYLEWAAAEIKRLRDTPKAKKK